MSECKCCQVYGPRPPTKEEIDRNIAAMCVHVSYAAGFQAGAEAMREKIAAWLELDLAPWKPSDTLTVPIPTPAPDGK